ncbi:MAG: hypothetical protein QOF76_5089 [Solirubrobacteraceae bacterium]|jgi:hypothetical protein|nr:hypothetical protein [Solirubrobacteraceae bacterium]
MSSPARDPLREMKDVFLAAATLEVARNPAPSRRPRGWRLAGVVAAGAVGTAGVAVGSGLIPLGSPTNNPKEFDQNRPQGAVSQIAVQARDPRGVLPYGVVVYRSRSGADCAEAGQVRAGRLGELRGQTFHPYAPERAGACGRLARLSFFGDGKQTAHQFLYYGRARAGIARMEITVGTRVLEAPTGRRGAFIFVLPHSSGLPSAVTAFDRSGRQIH